MAGVGGIALVKHGDELCFEESIFLEPEFNAERFVSSCRRRVTLEHLRVDLEAFFKTLKTALVELINSDYADFVSLSAKLVGPVVVRQCKCASSLSIWCHVCTTAVSFKCTRTQAGLESSIASLSSPLGQLREELLVRASCVIHVRDCPPIDSGHRWRMEWYIWTPKKVEYEIFGAPLQRLKSLPPWNFRNLLIYLDSP